MGVYAFFDQPEAEIKAHQSLPLNMSANASKQTKQLQDLRLKVVMLGAIPKSAGYRWCSKQVDPSVMRFRIVRFFVYLEILSTGQ